MQNHLMAGISGVRGVVGHSLTPEVALRYSSAFGNLCRSGKVVVGRDSRTSGEMIKSAVISGLLATGCSVIDLDICTTPTVEIAVEDLKANGGIIVTASHNPIQWNALKFVGSDGIFLSPEETQKLFDLVHKDQIRYQPWNKIGNISSDSSWSKKHIEKILGLKYINVKKIRQRKFKVVLDCCNGAGGVVSPHFLKALDCKVIELNCQPNGLFPHDPEPVPRNLTSLCRAVKIHRADLGFANDPDVDRLAIVSEKGTSLSEEATLALVTRFILNQKPKSRMVTNISTSRMIDDIARESDSKVYRTKVGEAHVARKLKQVKGMIGGEGNGGVILPELHYGRDALVGMALILEYLAESGKSTSLLASELPRYFMVKKKTKLTRTFGRNLIRLKKKYSGGRMNSLDGLRIDYDDFWLQVRKSNTEPQVRIIAEARSNHQADELTTDALKILNS
jgi:phosphomannomutase